MPGPQESVSPVLANRPRSDTEPQMLGRSGARSAIASALGLLMVAGAGCAGLVGPKPPAAPRAASPGDVGSAPPADEASSPSSPSSSNRSSSSSEAPPSPAPGVAPGSEATAAAREIPADATGVAASSAGLGPVQDPAPSAPQPPVDLDAALSAEAQALLAPPPEPPAHPWLGAGRPARVLIVGDSMAATDFGRELASELERRADVEVSRRGRSSSGLARPDFFDWFEEGARLVKRHRPDLVVVVIGGNDGQDLRPKTEGRWVHWRSERWAEAYQARTNAFLDRMASKDRRFVWIELPAMEHRRLEGKLKTIRAVQAEALAARDDVLAQVPGRPCFYDGPSLLRTVPTGPDAGAPMRLDDGIHFTVPGARHYAACVAPAIEAFLPPKPAAGDST